MAGMSGELRQKVTIFLSEGGGGPEPEYFARIEEVVDSFGNRITGGAAGAGELHPTLVLRPGDRVLFRGQAWDPQGSTLRWQVLWVPSRRTEEYAGNTVEVEWTISEADIGESSIVSFSIVPSRQYFRRPVQGCDDRALLVYTVLPRR